MKKNKSWKEQKEKAVSTLNDGEIRMLQLRQSWDKNGLPFITGKFMRNGRNGKFVCYCDGDDELEITDDKDIAWKSDEQEENIYDDIRDWISENIDTRFKAYVNIKGKLRRIKAI